MRLSFANRGRPATRSRTRVRRGTGRGLERGQGLVEFALVAPILFLVLFAVIQLGILFGTLVGMSNAARETARYASTVVTATGTTAATNKTTILDSELPKRMRQYLIGYSSADLVSSGTPTTDAWYCYYPNPNGTTYGVRVVVQVQYKQVLLLPLVGAILDGFDGAKDGRLRLGVREEMRVENQTLKSIPTGITTSC